MSKLYQSSQWQHIQKEVYQNHVDFVKLWEAEYMVSKKSRSLFGLEISFYQIMWIDITKTSVEDIKKYAEFLGQSFGTAYLQVWIINPSAEVSVNAYRHVEWFHWVQLDWLLDQKKKLISKLGGSNKAMRTNMPDANLIVDLSQGIERIRQSFSTYWKTQIKRAIHKWLKVEVATPQQRDEFYEVWLETSHHKGFHIISYETYKKLQDYLLSTNSWNLFVSEHDGKVVNGSIYIFCDDTIVYMYGWTNRDISKWWAGYLMKSMLFEWGIQNGYKYFDFLGISPFGVKWHSLEWVTQFKESFGWTRVEYLGNIDIPLNKLLYSLLHLRFRK